MEFAYFPSGSIISLSSILPSGQSVETRVVGFEGMSMISCVLGVDRSPHEAVVQYPNGALRISVNDLRREFDRGGALQMRLLRYVQTLLDQTSQVEACNRLHALSERLARWLLMSQDRCECDELSFTPEFLALMLGTGRAGVTEAAIVLQTEECIKYRRGHITILDRESLMHHACECYPIIKTAFDLANAA